MDAIRASLCKENEMIGSSASSSSSSSSSFSSFSYRIMFCTVVMLISNFRIKILEAVQVFNLPLFAIFANWLSSILFTRSLHDCLLITILNLVVNVFIMNSIPAISGEYCQ